jgi:hypothetical protein
MNNWYVKCKPNYLGICSPIDPLVIMQFDSIPEGNWFGPYCCKDCANICASYGKTERQAWEFNHGTDEQKSWVFFNGA